MHGSTLTLVVCLALFGCGRSPVPDCVDGFRLSADGSMLTHFHRCPAGVVHGMNARETVIRIRRWQSMTHPSYRRVAFAEDLAFISHPDGEARGDLRGLIFIDDFAEPELFLDLFEQEGDRLESFPYHGRTLLELE